MDLLQFLYLLVVAGIAAGVYALIVGWAPKVFAAMFVFGALLLVLPAILARLIGGA